MHVMRQIRKQIATRRPAWSAQPFAPQANVRRPVAAAAESHEHPEEMWIELAGSGRGSLRAARALRGLPNVTRVDVRRVGRWLVVTGCELAIDEMRSALDPLGVEVESWFLFNVGGFDEHPRTSRDG